MLRAAKVDTLITAAGSVPLQGLLAQHPDLKQVVWVVERTSRHMEWNEVPEGVGGQAEIGVWHDIIEERRSSVSADFPPDTAGKEPTTVIVVSENASSQPDGFEVVEFPQQVGPMKPIYQTADTVLTVRSEHRCGCLGSGLSTSTTLSVGPIRSCTLPRFTQYAVSIDRYACSSLLQFNPRPYISER